MHRKWKRRSLSPTGPIFGLKLYSVHQKRPIIDNQATAKPVQYCSLFRYSTRCERFAIVSGLFLAIISGLGIPLINMVYGEFANVLIDRQSPGNKSSEKTLILDWFGGGKVLFNASYNERMDALEEDAKAFAYSVFVFAGGTLILLTISVMIFNYTALLQVNRMRVLLFKSIISQNVAWFEIRGVPNISNVVSEDLGNVQVGIGERLSMFVYQMAVTILMLASCFYLGWLLTLILLIAACPMLIIFAVLHKIQSKLTTKEVLANDHACKAAEEAINCIRTVIAFNGQKKEIQRFTDKLSNYKSHGVAKGLAMGIALGIVSLIIYCCYAAAFPYGFRLILWSQDSNMDYTPNILIAVFFGVLAAASNLSYSGTYLESFATARGSAAVVFQIIETKTEINPFSDEGRSRENPAGEIEFRNVRFHYPTRSDSKILKGVSFKIRAGEKVAIVGNSGSGKSTILQLIQRLYDPTEGEVLLDGVNVKHLNVTWLRDQLGVILQEPMLFDMSIRDNIALGREGATNEEIVEAAKQANAHTFILTLNEEYKTMVGARGSKLSGGQKQRIAIARALIRNPKILLADEATSALDRESEKMVNAALNVAAVGRTTVIVSHKLQALAGMDRIIVLSNGVVVEDGSHETLMKRNGLYQELLQAEVQNFDRGRRLRSEPDSVVDKGKFVYEDTASILPGTRGSYLVSLANGSQDSKGSFNFIQDERFLKVTCCKFFSWNKPDRCFLLFGCLSSVILGCLLPCVCIIFGELTKLLAFERVEVVLSQVDFYAIIFVVFGIIAGVFSFLQIFLLTAASVRLNARLRKEIFKNFLYQESAWFDSEKNSLSTLLARLTTDCSSVPAVICSRVGIIIQGMTSMLLGAILSVFYSWKMSLVTITVLPIIFFGIYLDLVSSAKQKKAEMESLQGATKIAVDVISNMKVVNALGKEKYFLEKFKKTITDERKCNNVWRSFLRGVAYSLGQTAPFFGYALSLWYGAYLIRHDDLHYKDVIKVSELLIYGAWMMGQSMVLAPNFKTARIAAGRLQYIFLRRPKIRDGSKKTAPNLLEGSMIEFSNVYFSYPTRPDLVILRNINLSIQVGQSIALVGPSGSGKSTIIQLLLRLYDPNVGSITIGNIKISNYELAALRGVMGLVSQEPALFDRTIFENIAYGDNSREVKLEEVIAAAKQANVHGFITSLPLGYNTKLGTSFGTQLSGGQKQLIAIARVLVRDPKILLLDEATSALDPQSEQSIQEVLDVAMNGRTTITVAHRSRAIAKANVIHVISQGQIVEIGSHNQLMEKKGLYYEMHGGGT